MSCIYSQIQKNRANGKKMLAILLDPDKVSSQKISYLTSLWHNASPDFIFVGGSLVNSDTSLTIDNIKQCTNLPIVLFPGSVSQLSCNVDALLFLSLISGRNPEYLIGQHTQAAFSVKHSGIEVIPTGYMLIDGGVVTSVQYVSGTMPIPRTKTDIAVSTAIAGELLGLKMLYLEAGSGAAEPVPCEMIKAIRQMVDVPIIVGGGLRSAEAIANAYKAGADMVVVGTAIENNPLFWHEIAKVFS